MQIKFRKKKFTRFVKLSISFLLYSLFIIKINSSKKKAVPIFLNSFECFHEQIYFPKIILQLIRVYCVHFLFYDCDYFAQICVTCVAFSLSFKRVKKNFKNEWIITTSKMRSYLSSRVMSTPIFWFDKLDLISLPKFLNIILQLSAPICMCLIEVKKLF